MAYDALRMPLARTESLIVRELQDEMLVYDLSRHDAYCLNGPAALVWKHCDGRKGVRDVAHILEMNFGSEGAEDIVWFALDRLRKARLLVNGPAHREHPAPLSRRDLMRKLGIASVLAIPVITSIVAPQAAQAQSCIGPRLPPAFCDANAKGRCCTNNRVCNGVKCV